MTASTVRLEPLGGQHATAEYVAWLNDPKVVEFLEARHHANTIESVSAYIAHCRGAPNVEAFALLIDSVFGGTVKLSQIDRANQTAFLGVMVGDRRFWGQGIGTAAIRAAASQASAMGLRKLTAGVYATHYASLRAFLKAGWKIEGVQTAQFVTAEGTEDCVRLTIFLDS